VPKFLSGGKPDIVELGGNRLKRACQDGYPTCRAIGGLSLLATTAGSTLNRAELGSFLGIGEGLEDFILVTDAYIFGYPLVTMEMTRKVVTNVAEPVGTRGPMGRIIKLREYPDASFRDISAPNADTLYTTSFLDVGKLAMGVQHPRHEGSLRALPNARRLDHNISGAGETYHRHRCADLCDHWTGMEGHAAGQRQGVQGRSIARFDISCQQD
jgi:hypothetical protein